jgi:hypothetical protein
MGEANAMGREYRRRIALSSTLYRKVDRSVNLSIRGEASDPEFATITPPWPKTPM